MAGIRSATGVERATTRFPDVVSGEVEAGALVRETWEEAVVSGDVTGGADEAALLPESGDQVVGWLADTEAEAVRRGTATWLAEAGDVPSVGVTVDRAVGEMAGAGAEAVLRETGPRETGERLAAGGDVDGNSGPAARGAGDVVAATVGGVGGVGGAASGPANTT